MPGAFFPASEIQRKMQIRGISHCSEFSGIKMPFSIIGLIIADDAAAGAVRCKVQKMCGNHFSAQNVPFSPGGIVPAMYIPRERLHFHQFLSRSQRCIEKQSRCNDAGGFTTPALVSLAEFNAVASDGQSLPAASVIGNDMEVQTESRVIRIRIIALPDFPQCKIRVRVKDEVYFGTCNRQATGYSKSRGFTPSFL